MTQLSTRAVQLFSDDYLRECQKVSLEDRIKFVEDLRRLAYASAPEKNVLISMRIGDRLLKAFQNRCKRENIPYQQKIRALMRDYLGISTQE